MTTWLIDLFGYAASAMLLLGVALVRVPKYNLQVDVMMTVGQTLLCINSSYHGAYPSALLNGVCVVLNLINIRRDLNRNGET